MADPPVEIDIAVGGGDGIIAKFLNEFVTAFVGALVSQFVAEMLGAPYSTGGPVVFVRGLMGAIDDCNVSVAAMRDALDAIAAAESALPAAVWQWVPGNEHFSEYAALSAAYVDVAHSTLVAGWQSQSPGFRLSGDTWLEAEGDGNPPYDFQSDVGVAAAPQLRFGNRVALDPTDDVLDENQTLPYLEQIAAWNPGFEWTVNGLGYAMAQDTVSPYLYWVCKVGPGEFEWLRRWHYRPSGSSVAGLRLSLGASLVAVLAHGPFRFSAIRR